jgi:hypothetical protein
MKFITLKELEYRKSKLEKEKTELEEKARRDVLDKCSYVYTQISTIEKRLLEIDFLIDFVNMKDENFEVIK